MLFRSLRRAPGAAVPVPPLPDADPLADDDLQLALYVCYELHYAGFAGVAPEWEWEPALLALRRRLETRFEARLREMAAPEGGGDPVTALRTLARGGDGRSLSAFAERDATLEQVRELCVHRSLYQLKEADPHTWAIPRLTGAAKAAMVAIQADEYGAGDAAAMHSALFADTMRALGLDATYGSYVDLVPAPTLATVNLISLLGLHRRLRSALAGHLALFEMTSVVPMRRYSRTLARLGLPTAARRFYDVHVEADGAHQEIALNGMIRPLVAAEPAAGGEVAFGARALVEVERRFADHVLDRWSVGSTSLRAPLRSCRR